MVSFSSVAPSIVEATLSQHADITLNNVNMHPDKTGFLRYAILMGARIHILDQRWIDDQPVSNLRVQHAKQLQAIEVREEHIDTLKDELPLLCMMAAHAKGTSIFPNDPSLNDIISLLKENGTCLEETSRQISIIGAKESSPPFKSLSRT